MGLRMSLRSIGLGVSVLFSLSRFAAASPANSPSGIDAISAYAGTWKIEIQRVDTAHSKAGHENSVLRNSCWKDGAYLACNQYVDGDSKILLVFTYHEKDKTYTSYQIPQDGTDAGKGKMLIEENVWTFPWQITEKDATTYYRVVNTFTSRRRIEYRQEFSPDNVHWTVMATGIENKTSDQ